MALRSATLACFLACPALPAGPCAPGVRWWVPDVFAGLQLRAHRVHEAAFDGVVWQVSEIGFLTTQLCRAGEFCRVQNRQVLQARMQERPLETASR